MQPRWALAVGLVALLASMTACAGVEPTGSPRPSVSPPPSASGELSQPELKLRLLHQLGALWYCDPDAYPVARGDEQQLAIERFDEIQSDRATFDAISAALDLSDPHLTDAQKLAVYRTWKQLNAIQLESRDGNRYAFDILTRAGDAETGTRTQGTITSGGEIEIDVQEASNGPACPICLARGTRIATPGGSLPVEQVRVGDEVWTADTAGHRVAAPVIRVGSVSVPTSHRVVDLVLADGRKLSASPGHRTADGHPLGSLRPGDIVDESVVLSAELVSYRGGATFDLLPAGPTGIYWAEGIPLASTLTADWTKVGVLSVRPVSRPDGRSRRAVSRSLEPDPIADRQAERSNADQTDI